MSWMRLWGMEGYKRIVSSSLSGFVLYRSQLQVLRPIHRNNTTLNTHNLPTLSTSLFSHQTSPTTTIKMNFSHAIALSSGFATASVLAATLPPRTRNAKRTPLRLFGGGSADAQAGGSLNLGGLTGALTNTLDSVGDVVTDTTGGRGQCGDRCRWGSCGWGNDGPGRASDSQ